MNFKSTLTKPVSYNNEYHNHMFGNWRENLFYKMKGEVAKRNIFDFDFNPGSKVLDFGCGIGQITAWIKNKYGYELNQEIYPELKKRGFKMFNSISSIPENYFDEIVISMVLEHLENPIETIKVLSTKLKQGGKIRINLPTPSFRVETDYEKLNSSHNGHYFSWGFSEINYLLNRCGFKVLLNKVIHRKGIDRFFCIYRIFGFDLYDNLITLCGLLFASRDVDIIIVAEKI